MAGLNLRLRGAAPGEDERLWDFYQDNLVETLPVPSVGAIRTALQRGSLLIAEDVDDNSILAAAGYFEYIKSVDRHTVFEFAATRVTKKIGHLLPIPLQQVFLALRLFQIVSTEDQTKRSISVMSSARSQRSKNNLVAFGMTEIAAMPRWMDYDTYSWVPLKQRNEWCHYIADCACLDKAIDILSQAKFAEGRLECQSDRTREDKSSERVDVSISYDLQIGALFPSLVQARNRKEFVCGLTSLPASLPY